METGEGRTQSYRNYSIQPERAAGFGGSVSLALTSKICRPPSHYISFEPGIFGDSEGIPVGPKMQAQPGGFHVH